MDRPTLDGRATGRGRSVEGVRMLPIVLGALGRAFMYRKTEEVSFVEKPERAVIGVTEASAGLNDLVEDRLEPGRARNGAKNAADRELLRSKVLDLTNKRRVVVGHSSHARSLGRRRSRRPPMRAVAGEMRNG
jgi:hypothetical protein